MYEVLLGILILWILDLFIKPKEVSAQNHYYGGLYRRPPIPQDVRRFVFERDGYRCVYCGSSYRIELDHRIPWSICRSHDINNLQTLCFSCNRRKGAKIL